MFENLWLVPLGFVAGIVGSIIGLGGGIIVVPALTFWGLPPTISSSTSLFAAFSNAIASSISYTRQRRIIFRTGIQLGLMSVPGTILGAYLSSIVSLTTFKILFGVVLLASCYYLFVKRNLNTNNSPKLVVAATFVISFLAGILSSFFGIGGGIIFVPMMIIGLGILVKNATATSQLILLFSSAAGLVAHSILGHSEYVYALYLSVGAFFGGIVGARLSVEIKENSIRIMICVAMAATAIKLFIDGLGVWPQNN